MEIRSTTTWNMWIVQAPKDLAPFKAMHFLPGQENRNPRFENRGNVLWKSSPRMPEIMDLYGPLRNGKLRIQVCKSA